MSQSCQKCGRQTQSCTACNGTDGASGPVHGRRWLSLAGGCVLAFAIAAGAAGCGGSDLSQLRPGQCISGEPYLYPPHIKVIDCSEADPAADTMVVFAESATGNSYPGNLDEMNARCAGEGGFFLEPSSETWDHGDRVGLCLTPAVMSQ